MSRLRSAPVSRPLLAGLTSLIAATAMLAARPVPAEAAVTHQYGYQATVLGFSSWYGSYGMSSLGAAWCIDHGIRSPDPAYQYAVADVSTIPIQTRTAMAWAVGRWGHGTDRLTHAAVMLVLHDLMGATYPHGRLDVDRLAVTGLAGFAGDEAEVLARARLIKDDGVAHGHLRGSLHLTLALAPVDPQGDTVARLSLRDDRGQAVPGVTIVLDGAGAGLQTQVATTDAAGLASVVAHPTAATATVRAQTIVPVLDLEVWRSSSTPAQRVTRPTVVGLVAEAALVPPPTTTTTVPPTTTTLPPTTTIPPTTTTTVSPPPPVTVLGAPPAPPAPTLPRTGFDALTGALYGIGLVLVGHALVNRPGCLAQPSAPPDRSAAMRSSS